LSDYQSTTCPYCGEAMQPADKHCGSDECKREHRRLLQNEYVRRSYAKRVAAGIKRRLTVENVCQVCGVRWMSKKHSTYCYEHKDWGRIQKAAAEAREVRRERRVYAALRRSRPEGPRQFVGCRCEICGQAFVAIGVRHTTCSPNCRQVRRAAVRHIREQYEKALTRGQMFGVFSASEWGKRLQQYEGACVYCGAKEQIEIEHVIPLGIGGSQLIANVYPACHPCNHDKNMATPSQWLARSGRAQAIDPRLVARWPEGEWAGAPL
jgi:5-methylcytosine-specific restriction endonuclease McrA